MFAHPNKDPHKLDPLLRIHNRHPRRSHLTFLIPDLHYSLIIPCNTQSVDETYFEMNSGRRSNTDEMMRMEHLMLREQGMALMRAGHMMNTQASIINSYMRDRSAGEKQKKYGL